MKIAKLNGRPEIFHTIQGEGKSMGMSSIFIRLSLCNLQCVWCDTDYTWNFTGTSFTHIRDQDPGYKKFNKENVIIELTPLEAADELFSFSCPNIVITGGEPLLQQNDLVTMLTRFRDQTPDAHVEIETNGTLIPSDILAKLVDQYNVSPKLDNSGNSTSQRIKSDALTWFADQQSSNFKFVVETEQDLEEIQQLVQKFKLPPRKIFLMPQGTDESTLNKKRSWLVEICKRYNYNFTDRLHIHLFGNKRGV